MDSILVDDDDDNGSHPIEERSNNGDGKWVGVSWKVRNHKDPRTDGRKIQKRRTDGRTKDPL